MSENTDRSEYREFLIATQSKLNENYDKLVVTLSGGALALSMTFISDIVNLGQLSDEKLLLFSWGLFVLSIASILGEILFGIHAYKRAVRQLDSNEDASNIGGWFGFFSTCLQRLAALSLLAGLITISYFVYLNMAQ